LIEFNLFERIQPTELLNQAWNKTGSQQNAANVLGVIARTNAVSLWVAHLIIEPTLVKRRAQRWEKLIKVAKCLRELNNFSTLMAFLGGFNNSAVARLTHTRNNVPRKSLESLAEFETMMSVEHSSKNYREALHNSNPPIIPYIGTYLTDLTFIDDGNKDLINNLLNFYKRSLTHKSIAEIQRFQQIGYCLRPVTLIEQYVRDIPPHDDEKAFQSQLYEFSLQREPRGAEKVS